MFFKLINVKLRFKDHPLPHPSRKAMGGAARLRVARRGFEKHDFFGMVDKREKDLET